MSSRILVNKKTQRNESINDLKSKSKTEKSIEITQFPFKPLLTAFNPDIFKGITKTTKKVINK